ncbi:transcription factor bHLH144 isoform X1 [Brassica napus]|uniref:transcription factor bHLH144 isoform X1 n=1 Tax=Brassica napus TaxID=3708 RepID=UPI0020790164|nr:transcription factor bHLH144 isoform X1 [Brassica napus]
MCFVGNKKGALKEIGTFMMTTCFIANYQSVQVSQNNQYPHFSDEMGDGNMNFPYSSSFDDLFPPCAKLPFHGVELQPSPVCPKNFVIFDQTYDHSQVMYHPDLTPRLVNSGLASTFQNEYAGGSYGYNYGQEVYGNYGGGQEVVSSSYQEDPNEIDALLSTDEDDEGEEDGGDSEEVSTARNASRDYGNTSAESCCSSYGYNSSRRKQSSSGSAASSSNNDGKGGRKKKMKKMMGMLRKIVPGGEEMNTASVLDEAVQYLKSLKLEAQKLGVGHFSNQS